MTEIESLEKAAQVWCAKETRHKVMDVNLCREFARVLQREVNLREQKTESANEI